MDNDDNLENVPEEIDKEYDFETIEEIDDEELGEGPELVATVDENIEQVDKKMIEKIIHITINKQPKSSEYLTMFELTRIISDRAAHLDNGASPYIDFSGMQSSIEIAYNECLQRKLPFTVIRNHGKNEDHIELRYMNLPLNLPPKHWIV